MKLVHFYVLCPCCSPFFVFYLFSVERLLSNNYVKLERNFAEFCSLYHKQRHQVRTRTRQCEINTEFQFLQNTGYCNISLVFDKYNDNNENTNCCKYFRLIRAPKQYDEWSLVYSIEVQIEMTYTAILYNMFIIFAEERAHICAKISVVCIANVAYVRCVFFANCRLNLTRKTIRRYSLLALYL